MSVLRDEIEATLFRKMKDAINAPLHGDASGSSVTFKVDFAGKVVDIGDLTRGDMKLAAALVRLVEVLARFMEELIRLDGITDGSPAEQTIITKLQAY